MIVFSLCEAEAYLVMHSVTAITLYLNNSTQNLVFKYIFAANILNLDINKVNNYPVSLKKKLIILSEFSLLIIQLTEHSKQIFETILSRSARDSRLIESAHSKKADKKVGSVTKNDQVADVFSQICQHQWASMSPESKHE